MIAAAGNGPMALTTVADLLIQTARDDADELPLPAFLGNTPPPLSPFAPPISRGTGAAAAGRVVFVSNYGSAHVRSSDLADRPGNTLSAIDSAHPDRAPETIELGAGRCAPHGLAVSRDHQRLYVTCEARQGYRPGSLLTSRATGCDEPRARVLVTGTVRSSACARPAGML